ncbi:MAG: hypothetical protein Q4P17_03935 [Methanobacterium sp.]|nr:hypothetical protein [Methanobacterium sp.]
MRTDDMYFFRCSKCESYARINLEEKYYWENRACSCGGKFEEVE